MKAAVTDAHLGEDLLPSNSRAKVRLLERRPARAPS